MTQSNLLPDPDSLTPIKAQDFASFYEAVHGYRPFDWQKRLADQVCQGQWPDFMKLPTSSGKTAAIDIAVFALAYQGCPANRTSEAMTAARRIFFVVDRRIIVNEAYRQTRRMAERLWDAVQPGAKNIDPILRRVADWLRVLSNDPAAPPLDCHELRGGIYRDDAWVRSPLQPTVLTSTVDQVGSRMLFRGYGVSDRNQPIHAAMTVCDSLIILDEAHCSRPFSQTVESIARYRGQRWADEPLTTPFGLVQMTATPPKELEDKTLFEMGANDYQIDSLLEKRHACKKPVRLECEAGAKGKSLPAKLAKKLLREANNLADDGCRKIAVVVNRVAIARETFKLLEAKHGVRVRLMIGRMRPIDREELTGELQEQFGSGSKAEFDEPHFVVATQCLEVGADLDFDGMVSQCASLDSLRQRFGRLNRLGNAEIGRGVVVATAEDATEESKLNPDKPLDSVYGNASARTWRWLREVAGGDDDAQTIDFGIRQLDETITTSKPDLDELSAPSPHAPVLMPAHVDMLCQTSPRPALEPNVADLLHGPDRGIPEVRVCWRVDLAIGDINKRRERKRLRLLWHDTVAACPPSSSECLTVPLYIVKKWLGGEAVNDFTSDVLGEAREADTSDKSGETVGDRCELVWKPKRGKTASQNNGNKADHGSSLITSSTTNRLRNGDTIVLPVELGGWSELGHLPGAASELTLEQWQLPREQCSDDVLAAREAVIDVDVADAAFTQSRARTMLRIHPKLRASDLSRESYSRLVAMALDPESILRLDNMRAQLEPAEVDESASAHDGTQSDDQWQGERIDRLKSLGGTFARYANGIAWTTALHPDRSKGMPPLPLASYGDESDALSETGRLPLLQHLADVHAEAERLVHSLALAESERAAVLVSAKLHDIGKADPRFQAMLLGQPVSMAHVQRTLWAKSDGFGGSRASELPAGFRHEMLTLELLDRYDIDPAIDRDLVKHLDAAHHGHARPLAPVAVDDELPGFTAEAIVIERVTHEERVF